MTEDDIRDLFREMREDAVPADSLARVRLRTRDRLRRRVQWKVASWVMTGAFVVFAALLFRPGAVHKAVNGPVAELRTSPPAEQPAEPPRMAVRSAIRTARRRAEHESQTAAIRIETSDPDVVILLVGN